MDESLVDPSSMRPASSMAPEPEAAKPASPKGASTDPPLSALNQPGQRVPFQNSKMFVILPIFLIILAVGGGSYLISNRNSTASSVSTTVAPSVSNASTTLSASTSASSGSGAGNATCPCLSDQQLGQIFNVSAANNQGIFNLTFAPNNSALRRLQSSNPEANKTKPPEAVLDNLTEAWIVSYNALSAGSSTEVVMKSSDINGFINYFDSETESNSSDVPTATVNGFHYLYLDFPFFGINTITMEGYTNSYIVVFELAAPNSTTIASPDAIASEISNTT